MMGGGSWILGGLLMIVFWVFVVIMIVGIIRWFTWRGHAGPGGHMHMHMGGGSDRPMEILKERYAKGEITKEQFEQMKKDLQ